MRTIVILAVLWVASFIEFMTALGTGDGTRLLIPVVLWIIMILYLFRNQVIAWFNKL